MRFEVMDCICFRCIKYVWIIRVDKGEPGFFNDRLLPFGVSIFMKMLGVSSGHVNGLAYITFAIDVKIRINALAMIAQAKVDRMTAVDLVALEYKTGYLFVVIRWQSCLTRKNR